MKKNWYRRMLLSYFPIFFFTVTILIFLSLILVNDISHKETVKADRLSTDYMLDRLSRSLRAVEMDVLEELEKNDRYRDALNARTTREDRQVVIDVADSMRKLMANDGLIHSIYIYRLEDKQVLTTSGLVGWESFADRGFVERAMERPEFRGWSSIRTYREFSIDQERRVVSMYKRWPLPFGSEGLFVVNADVYSIEQMIRSMNDGDVSFVDVRDENGSLLFSTRSAEREESAATGGKVLNRATFEQLGWTFETGIAAGQMFMWVSVISYAWVGVGLVTIVFAIFYILYITRKNYQPIRVIMNRIESIRMSENDFGLKMDELSVIDQTLEKLIRQTEDFEKQQRENLLVQRRQLFHDMMQGLAKETAAERLKKLGMLPEAKRLQRLAFVVVEIGHYRDFSRAFSARDQHTLKFALTNVLQELAQTEGMYAWAEWIAENRMGVIVGWNGEPSSLRETIRRFADKGRDWVAEHLRLSLFFAIGSVERDWEGVGRSYRAALDALSHKMSLGKEAILMSEDLPGETGRQWYKYIQSAAELVKAFRLLNAEWRDSLDAMFDQMAADRLKDEDIRTALRTLMDMLGTELAEMSPELQAHFQAPEASEAAEEEAATLAELKSRMSERLTEIYRTYVAHSETKNHLAMIKELKAYIEEHFENPDLSLKHLSDRFHISGKYVSYLFKEAFNMKFVDYLAELRMDRAERLLAETEESIQRIALQVGYANSITFGRVFKRLVGVTPGDYRKLKLKPGTTRISSDI
ncbi:helix-turn-helix domain-containing protein [Paenibacillus antri]|uniref:Helix-turn-helix domain-containing protein n=1 Tax=Paenibacillus antri TaxID=2582848 RepID=A0A5R9G8W0_9BACL|nr:AraC family transcriptional regulator [Paenibacillus antri]TLS51509.1 helix-turn-helix domain-containing protein [Paenibacillus antri]